MICTRVVQIQHCSIYDSFYKHFRQCHFTSRQVDSDEPLTVTFNKKTISKLFPSPFPMVLGIINVHWICQSEKGTFQFPEDDECVVHVAGYPSSCWAWSVFWQYGNYGQEQLSTIGDNHSLDRWLIHPFIKLSSPSRRKQTSGLGWFVCKHILRWDCFPDTPTQSLPNTKISKLLIIVNIVGFLKGGSLCEDFNTFFVLNLKGVTIY